MMNMKPIKTEKEYKSALKDIEALLDSPEGSNGADRLEILSTLVEIYEEKHFPITESDPITAIEFWMDQNDLTRKDLESYIGSRARVAEVLNRKRPLTLPMIRKLSLGLGIPASLLIREYPLSKAA